MRREYILKEYITSVRNQYDYILIDGNSSLGMVTMNALTATDSIIIPIEAAYLSLKGLQQLITTIGKTKKYLKANIEYESLVEAYPLERREIEELVNLMVDVIVSKKPYIRINGCDMPYQVVRSTFEKQNYTTIEYILISMRQNTTKVRNIRSYMLTALYNAPLTCNNYYKAEVNHDLHGIDCFIIAGNAVIDYISFPLPF